jgi:flavin reductase (DIM6/NTAB) family NADH-FMN oxidoreductase RutF
MNLDALRKISYGMYIVGSHKGDKLNGQIANTVFQISSEPPTVAVSINKTNLTHEYIEASKVFSASFLCESATLPFIGGFGFKSGRNVDKMKGVNFKVGQTGSPIFLDNTTAYIEAEVINELDVITHTLYIGKVVAAEILNENVCMTYEYYHQVKRGTTPKTAPSYIPKEK